MELDEDERREDELMVRGVATVAARPRTGGAAGVEGIEFEVFVAAGLSQEEKKSSSPSAGVEDAVVSAMPSTKMRVGNLQCRISNLG